MRTSSYNIAVEVDPEKKIYAILNSYTQAFDLVNKDVYEFLKNRRKQQDISESTLSRLIKRGYITSLSTSEEVELIKRLVGTANDVNKLKRYNFHFIISYDCNLRCVYCYEDDLLNSCDSLSKNRISKEQIDKAFEIIEEKNKSNQCSKQIALYGGEPFLAENYETILYIAEKGKQIGCTFTVTTNGYDIDRYFDFLKDNKIFSFQITVDGIEEIQNQRKPHFKNKDSFKKITNNIDQLLKLGMPVSVRINTDSYSLERIDELLKYFKEMGWYDYKNFNANLALLREDVSFKDGVRKKEGPLNQLDLTKLYNIKKTKGELNEKVKCQDYGAYSTLKNLVLGKGAVSYRSRFCGAQSGNIIFDPLGDLYSCWDVVGRSEYKIGRYVPDFRIDNGAVDKWYSKNFTDYKCIKCKYNLFCGGGCIIQSLREKGEIESGNCNHYPEIFNHEMKVIYDELLKDKL